MKYLICGLGKSNNAILKSINGEKNEIYTYDIIIIKYLQWKFRYNLLK